MAGDIKMVRADLFNPAALDDAISGCDTAIHLIGIIMENTEHRRNIPAHARRSDPRVSSSPPNCAGVKRFIHMSALGVRADAVSNYGKTKWLGRGNRPGQWDGLDDFSSVDDPRPQR